jgi:hypothetical protein
MLVNLLNLNLTESFFDNKGKILIFTISLTFFVTVLLTFYLELDLEELIRDYMLHLTVSQVINQLIKDLGGLMRAKELREFSLDVFKLANLKFLLLNILGLFFVF